MRRRTREWVAVFLILVAAPLAAALLLCAWTGGFNRHEVVDETYRGR